MTAPRDPFAGHTPGRRPKSAVGEMVEALKEREYLRGEAEGAQNRIDALEAERDHWRNAAAAAPDLLRERDEARGYVERLRLAIFDLVSECEPEEHTPSGELPCHMADCVFCDAWRAAKGNESARPTLLRRHQKALTDNATLRARVEQLEAALRGCIGELDTACLLTSNLDARRNTAEACRVAAAAGRKVLG